MLPKIEKTILAYGKGMGEKKKLIYRTDVDKLDKKELNILELEEEDKVEKRVKDW